MGKARPALSPFSLISLREQSSSFSLQRASQRIGRKDETLVRAHNASRRGVSCGVILLAGRECC